MSQRTRAGLLALPLLAALWLVAVVAPLPYVTYYPGPTVDILAERQGQEIVQVSGHAVYRDEGELRLTTIYVDQPQDKVGLVDLMTAWLDPDAAVYPRAAVYAPDQTDESEDLESAVQMVSSQDAAVASALTALDYDVEEAVEVLNVEDGLPADGRLRVGDELVSIGGTPVTDVQSVVDAVDRAPVDQPLAFVVRRGVEQVTVQVSPRLVDGDKRVGITPGPGFTFPFEVSVDVGEGIGGPSAGLMFALAIYDTLTPGSVTEGHVVAGSGTIDAEGKVGPIGGIQQKVAGARDTGAELFLVPAANCGELGGVDTDDMTVAKVATLQDALDSVAAWTEDPDAALPSCENGA